MSLPFVAEMAVKSALIAVIGLLLAGLLKTRSPADRAAVLRLAIGLILLLPVISWLVPALQLEVAASPQAEVSGGAPGERNGNWLPAALIASEATAPAAGAEAASVLDDPASLITVAYSGGLLMGAGQLLAGLWALGRWTRSAEPLRCPRWTAAFDRIRQETGLTARADLLLSNEAPAPLSWGWWRPVILIDPDTARRPQDADAILEHEAAHILRNDWLALIIARSASILFWFNPLVWALERTLAQNTEEAADICALRRLEPTQYAATLLSCATQLCHAALPANSMTGSTAIGRRIKAILDQGLGDRRPGSVLAMLAMGLCIAVAGPVSAMRLVPARISTATVEAAPAEATTTGSAMGIEPADNSALVAAAPADQGKGGSVATAAEHLALPVERPAEGPAGPISPMPRKADAVSPDSLAVAAPALPAAAPAPPAPPVAPVPTATPVRSALLDVDTLVRMRIHGVSARFINEMAAAGYHRLSADQLINMRIHGVSAELARRAGAVSGRRPSPDELVDLAIHGSVR